MSGFVEVSSTCKDTAAQSVLGEPVLAFESFSYMPQIKVYHVPRLILQLSLFLDLFESRKNRVESANVRTGTASQVSSSELNVEPGVRKTGICCVIYLETHQLPYKFHKSSELSSGVY